VLLANAYDELPKQETHRVQVADLVEKLEFTSKNEAHLKEALTGLVGCKVEWNVLDKDHKWEWGVTTLLSEVTIASGVCTYAYGPMLRERLHNPNIYARISLSMQNKFDSKHALALWELCLDALDKTQQYGETPFMPVARFRQLMGIADGMYPQFKLLNHWVIKEPLAEINRVTDFQVEAAYRRSGRKVEAVRFTLRRIRPLPGQQTKQAVLFPDPEALPVVVQALHEAGLAVQDAWDVWQRGFEGVEAGKRPPGEPSFETYIQEKIHLLQQQPAGKVKSKTGFLLDAIKRNFANPAFAEAQRVQARRKQWQARQALAQEKARLTQAHDAQWRETCLQAMQAAPGFVEEVAQTLAAEDPFLWVHHYDRTRTPLENYHQSLFFAGHVHAKLQQHAPDRFVALEAHYREKMAELDRQLAALAG
jgi:hypothetical protein